MAPLFDPARGWWAKYIHLFLSAAQKGMKGDAYAQERGADPADPALQPDKWTKDEHEVFLQAVHLFGREWNRISEYMGTKSVAQVKAHAYAQFSKIQNGKSKGLIPPKPTARSAPYPEIPRPFPVLSPGEVMLRSYAERGPLAPPPPPPPPPQLAQPGARIPTHMPGLPHMMMAQSAMMEQERMKAAAYQNHMIMQNYFYQHHLPPQFPAHLIPHAGAATPTAAGAAAAHAPVAIPVAQGAGAAGAAAQAHDDRPSKAEKRRRERAEEEDDDSNLEEERDEDEYEPDEEYEDDSDAPRRRSKLKAKDQAKPKKHSRRSKDHRNGHAHDMDGDDGDSQSDNDGRARAWSDHKSRAKRDRKRETDDTDSNSPAVARNPVAGASASIATTNVAAATTAAAAAAAAVAAAARAKGIDTLRLNAADGISPDLQHMLQMQGQHAAGSHESVMGLGPDVYGPGSRAYPHPAMVPGAPFELLRAHHHAAAAYPGHPYGLPPGHAPPYGSTIAHVADPLHSLHAHGRYPLPDFLRRPGALPGGGVPMHIQSPGELYRMMGSGAAVPKPAGIPETAWSQAHGADEMIPNGLFGGATGLSAADPLLQHSLASRASLARAHEDAYNRSRLPTLPPAVPHSIPEIPRRLSPGGLSRPIPVKDDPQGSSNDLSDDRDDFSSKKKRERWTQEEHELFLKGLELYGRKWTKIQALIPNKTVTQVRTHAYGYFAKLLRRVPNERDMLEVAHIMSGMRNREGDEDEEDEEETDSRSHSKSPVLKDKRAASSLPHGVQAAAAPKTTPAPETTQPPAKLLKVESNPSDAVDAEGAVERNGKASQSEKRAPQPATNNPLHLLAKYADAGGQDNKHSSEDDGNDDEDDEDLESDEERRALEAIRSIARRGEQSVAPPQDSDQHEV